MEGWGWVNCSRQGVNCSLPCYIDADFVSLKQGEQLAVSVTGEWSPLRVCINVNTKCGQCIHCNLLKNMTFPLS